MKVFELIKELGKFPPKMEVYTIEDIGTFPVNEVTTYKEKVIIDSDHTDKEY